MISQDDDRRLTTGRKEHDSFGDIEVAAGASWGAQTERARRNFAAIGGGPMPPEFITAVALIKAAAARANARLGLLPADIASAIGVGGRTTSPDCATPTSFPSMCSRRAAAPAPT